MRLLILLFSLLTLSSVAQIEGEWHTSFVIGGQPMLVDMTVQKGEDGPEILFSDPKGTYENKKMDDVEIEGNSLSLKWKRVSLSYEATHYPDGDSIHGIMTQGDMKWHATFHREVQEEKLIHRPQEPKAPFDFTEEDLVLKNGEIELGASLTLPTNFVEGMPIVVLVSGSGAQDRNSEIGGHKPFLVIADHFAKNGIGCLRFDDRGTGKSTGIFAQANMDELAEDVRTMINHLAKQKRFRKSPIGVAGHSEGGMHAIIAAHKNRKVDFIVELASVGTSGRDIFIEQQYLIPKKNGKGETYAQWNQSVYQGMTDIILEYPQKEAVDTLAAFLGKKYKEAPEEYRETVSAINFQVGLAMFLNNQWGRDFMSYEAADYLKKIKVPILALNGKEDIQVPPVSSSNGFKANFSKRSAKYAEVMVLEGLNHLFQHCTTCDIYEYSELEETFSEDALQMMSDWIKQL